MGNKISSINIHLQ